MKKVQRGKKKGKKGSEMRKGNRLTCGVCGMSVVVDSICGCEATHPVVCCGTDMKSGR